MYNLLSAMLEIHNIASEMVIKGSEAHRMTKILDISKAIYMEELRKQQEEMSKEEGHSETTECP